MESVNLCLKTTEIDSSVDVGDYYGLTVSNSKGKIAQNRTSLTWYNINMRALLGELYDRYEKFNIKLNFVGGSKTGSTAETDEDYRQFQIKLGGLPFTSSYNFSSNSNIGSVIVSTIEVPLTASTTWVENTINSIPFTFTKTEYASLSIDLINVADDGYYTITSEDEMIGHCIFSFNISGVEDYKNINKKEDRVDLTVNRLEIGRLNKIYT